MRYAISYDLNNPGKNYEQLWNAIRSMGAQRILLSEWVTAPRTGTSAVQIRDSLWTFMDANDRLFVKCLDSADWAGMNLMVHPSRIAA
jgi:hypothetical protein